MNKLMEFLFILVSIFFYSCKTQTMDSLSLKNINVNDSKTLSTKNVQEEIVVIGSNKIHLKKNSLRQFYPNGSLFSGYLAKNQLLVVNGQRIKAKSIGKMGHAWGQYDIAFYDNGSLLHVWLSKNTRIKINNRYYFFLAAKTIVSIPLDASDSKAIGYLEYLHFYETGNAQSGFLAKSIVVNGHRIPMGALIRFDRTGHVISYSVNGDDVELDSLIHEVN